MDNDTTNHNTEEESMCSDVVYELRKTIKVRYYHVGGMFLARLCDRCAIKSAGTARRGNEVQYDFDSPCQMCGFPYETSAGGPIDRYAGGWREDGAGEIIS